MQTVILSSPYARQRAHQLIDKAPDGCICNVRQPNRTSEQNARMWAMLGDISIAKPEGRDYPPEIWKSLFMAEAGFKPRFEPSLDGRGVVPIGYKSSRLTKAEFSDLMEAIAAYGAEHGVRFHEPDASALATF